MKFRYPRVVNWLEFHKNQDGSYSVMDELAGSSFTMGSLIGDFARRLDGRTDPYAAIRTLSRREVRELLDILEQNKLLRVDRQLLSVLDEDGQSLWIPRKHRTESFFPKIFNLALMLLWLPVFFLGLRACGEMHMDGGLFWILPGFLIASVLGVIGHELAHAAAIWSYGGAVFEVGLGTKKDLSGYVLGAHRGIRSRLKQVQICAAGLEMNLLLTGAFLLLAARFEAVGPLFVGAAIREISLVCDNIAYEEGLDGEHILGWLLGTESLARDVEETLKDRKKVERLRKRGLVGMAELYTCRVVAGGSDWQDVQMLVYAMAVGWWLCSVL